MKPTRSAASDHQADADDDAPAVDDEVGGDDHQQAHQRADREVESGADDHHLLG